MKRNVFYKIKIILLLLFVFSLPFEYWDPFGIAHFFTITKFTGLLYFVFSLFSIKKNFSLAHLKKPIVILFSLWLWMLFTSIFNHWPGSSLSIFSFTFFQNIILFWLIANDLINNKNLLKYLLLILMVSVFITATLTSFGIGLDTTLEAELGTVRLSFFGSNPNTVGNLASISMLFVFVMVLDKSKYFGRKTLLLLFTIPSLLSLLMLSGSRGALVISLIGIIILVLFQKGSMLKRISLIALGSITILLGVNFVLESELIQSRVYSTIQNSNLGGREEIWIHALEIFYDNPFFGVGVSGYQYEIINRYGFYMDTHNIFLYFMVTGGVIALFLYLLFLFTAYRGTIKYLKNNRSPFLLSIFYIYIFSVFKSGGAINNKLYWILLAIVFGVYLSIHKKKNSDLSP